MRTGARFGRIFRLRDRGQLEAALEQGVALAHDLSGSTRLMDKPLIMVAAATVDEIATRLGRPEEAREILQRALAIIDAQRAEMGTATRRKAGDYWSLLDSYERSFRERLAAMGPRP
jgi:hypothetical protein